MGDARRILEEEGNEIELPKEEGIVDPFLVRPLPPLMEKYAVGDVRFLPALFTHHVENRFWNDEWAQRVWQESGKRLEDSRAAVLPASMGWQRNWAPEGWSKIKQVDKTSLI